MRKATLTIRIEQDLDNLLTETARRSGRSRSEAAREALRRQLRVESFGDLRRRIMPFAEARGYVTDEDVFEEVA